MYGKMYELIPFPPNFLGYLGRTNFLLTLSCLFPYGFSEWHNCSDRFKYTNIITEPVRAQVTECITVGVRKGSELLTSGTEQSEGSDGKVTP
jgi:hypothetical protein